MYKLIKTKIVGTDNRPDIRPGFNGNYRTTMGYDTETNTINVKVDKLIRPDLTRDESAQITFEIVDEKSFTKEDFAQSKDLMAWCVDFDVTTEKITTPFSIYDYTANLSTNGTYHNTGMWVDIAARYSENLLPLFTVDSFYKNVSDFSLSTLQFHVVADQIDELNTVITNTDVEEMALQEKVLFLNKNINTHVFYEIFDESDNLVSSIVNSSAHPQVKPAGVFTSSDPVRALFGNRYRASLPNATEYKVRVLFHNDLLDKTISARFDVEGINLTANKTRVDSGIKDTGLQSYSGGPFDVVDINGNPRFAGSETIKISLNLDSGDYAKVKLSVGDFYSYSELWIDII